jgi:hypothetical protein
VKVMLSYRQNSPMSTYQAQRPFPPPESSTIVSQPRTKTHDMPKDVRLHILYTGMPHHRLPWGNPNNRPAIPCLGCGQVVRGDLLFL